MSPTTPEERVLLDAFPALDRVELFDLRRHPSPADLGWLEGSTVARTRLRRVGRLALDAMPGALALWPRLSTMESVDFLGCSLRRTPTGVELETEQFAPHLEERIAALPPGSLGAIAVDARGLDKRKDGHARLEALSQRLGATVLQRSPAETRARAAERNWAHLDR